ncbi:NAC domain-containing protein 101-like [Actinidia eriantha]|uniref:NAC domain-containing protein 101-like n=1 Tax=Actinidia eriantha TaxID=165200 RepID=UPI00258C4903|nr:NAC domain-containing protein 101-like [Actinidia eriantha]
MAPRPRDSIGLYWTDEAIIMSLERMEKGSPVPENVSVDVNPYQCKPSYLPDGIWYLIRSDHNKNSEHGFWRARGEAIEIFMNSVIKGWRTTLDFYEGWAPHGQRTNWVMQEYRITRKGLCSYSNPKESNLLCRVFLSSGGSNQETKLNLGGKEIAGGNHIHPKPSVVPRVAVPPDNVTARNRDDNTGPLAVPGGLPIIALEDMDDDDCFSRGDYLELNDLLDGESKSSSSDNSSCVTPTSDKYFDSQALLRDLEVKINRDEQGKDANVKLSVAASIKPNDVVMRPSNLGSLVKNDGRKSPAKTIDKKFLDKKVPENAIRSKKARKWNEGTSNSHDVATSSRSHKAIPRGEKKAVAGRTKKLKKYLCFMPF